MRRHKKGLILALALVFSLATAAGALALTGDWYAKFAKDKAFKCIHPKSKVIKVEVLKPPKLDKDVESATIKIYYKGWIKKHSMEMVIMTTKIGGKLNAKVQVLVDTASIKNIRCKLVKGWQVVQ
ncbi:MAG: hypothetical protein KJ621_02105 [Proteobacteria bacterium]|nr:hypothetical protein [Pseudomonadota bacterium]MBU1743065.1 hypothetical protein [Pseudomonadota bacterium]